MPRKPKRDKIPGLLERPPGSGNWHIRYRDEFGKDTWEAVGEYSRAKDLLEVRRGHVKAIRDEARAKRITPADYLREQERKGLTVSGMVDRYRKEFAALKSARVVEGYLAEWTKVLGDRLAAEVTAGDVIEWQLSKAGQGMKDGTINRYVAYLRRLYNLAIRDFLVDVNPCGNGRVPARKETGRRERVLELHEERQLAAALEPLDRAAFVLCLYSGMRQGEALGLRREDVDFQRRRATLGDTKAGKRQVVYLSEPALAAVRFAMSHHDKDFLFPHRSKPGPMSGSRLTERLQKVAKELGMTDVLWYTLRHTFVDRLSRGGADIGTVQETARHSTIIMTRHYMHPSDEAKLSAVDGLAEKFAVGATYFPASPAARGHLRAL